MKKCFFIFIIFLLFKYTLFSENKNNITQILKNQRDRISYSIGMVVGNDLKSQTAFFNVEPLIMGIKDALTGQNQLMTDSEIKQAMDFHKRELILKEGLILKKIIEQNKKEEAEFFKKNKKRKDIKNLPSGLQYKIIREGKGKIPKLDDAITVNYRGTYVDGTEFDSSYARKQPMTCPVSSLIPGWKEAMLLMKAGSKWELFIPSKLAYGNTGNGIYIGPNKTLIFTVEFIAIEKTEKK